MKTKIAVLGVGRWGTNLLRNFRQHPQAEIVALVDRHPERLARSQQQFNLDKNKVILTTEWEYAKQQKDIDAVVVATPASTHYSLIADALETGYHVLAEKPLTLDASESIELTRLAEKKQKQLLVDHTYLFNPAVERGERVIKAGNVGKLRYGYATRTNLGPVRYDVDALWDLAIHDIAIFNRWLAQIPIKVQARGSVWLQNSVSDTQSLSDLVWLTLIYPDGFQAYIHLCWLNPDKQRRLCVVGDRGTLIFDEMSKETPLSLQKGYFDREGQFFLPTGVSSEAIDIEKEEPLKRVCDRFLSAIELNNSCSISSGWVASELVNILSCLSLSLQGGGKTIAVPQLSFLEE